MVKALLMLVVYYQVDPANVRSIEEGSVDALLEAERVAEATKQAIKRKFSTCK